MLNVTTAEPDPLVAVTVYTVAGEAVVPIPEITPVFVLKDKPAGKVGLILQLTTLPDTVGERNTLSEFALKMFVVGYCKDVGACANKLLENVNKQISSLPSRIVGFIINWI